MQKATIGVFHDPRPLARAIDKLLVEGTLIREQDYLKEDKAEKLE